MIKAAQIAKIKDCILNSHEKWKDAEEWVVKLLDSFDFSIRVKGDEEQPHLICESICLMLCLPLGKQPIISMMDNLTMRVGSASGRQQGYRFVLGNISIHIKYCFAFAYGETVIDLS